MTTDRIIHDRIMRRVHRIFLLRKLLHPSAVSMYTGTIIWAYLFSLVSVEDVVHNLINTGTIQAAPGFMMHAFMHTEQLVQIGVFIGGVAVALLLRDLIRWGALFYSPPTAV